MPPQSPLSPARSAPIDTRSPAGHERDSNAGSGRDRRNFLRLVARGTIAGALIPALPRSLPASGSDSAPASPLPRRTRRNPLGLETDWDAVKAGFDLRPGVIPMNAANLAPAPRSVLDAIDAAARAIDADASFQNRASYDALRERVRERLALYLGAHPEEIALVRNATEANNIIASGVPLEAGDEVVIHSENHPSNNVSWEVRAARDGIRLRRVELRPEMSNEEQIDSFREAFTPRTRVLTFTDVSNTTGVRLPARELARVARERGIHVHIDGAQSFGKLQLDLQGIGCDSYGASAHKWFMGPKESGVLFVRAGRIPEIWPGVVSVGWGGSGLPGPQDARRFESLGQRDDAVFAGLDAALDFHEFLGAGVIEARVLELATLIKREIAEIDGAEIVTPMEPERSGGVVIVRFEALDESALYRALYDEYEISCAPTGGLRLCPHIYTTEEDVRFAIDAVRLLAARDR